MTLKYQDLETKIERFFKAHGVKLFNTVPMPFGTFYVSTDNQEGYQLVVAEKPKAYHDKYIIRIENGENYKDDCIFVVGKPTLEEAIVAANCFMKGQI
jgi:hypothetical protein